MSKYLVKYTAEISEVIEAKIPVDKTMLSDRDHSLRCLEETIKTVLDVDTVVVSNLEVSIA